MLVDGYVEKKGQTTFSMIPKTGDPTNLGNWQPFGQPPGIGHDANHLYTGGSRMCRGEGQVQAGLLTKGLEVCCGGGGAGDCSEDLADGRGIACEVVAAR